MTPSPALPREGQPGIPGQVQDHLTSHAGEVLTVSEARVAPEKLLRQALDVLNETIPDWRTPMEKQRRMAACRVAIDGFLAAPRRETQPLTEQRIDALAKQHLKAFAQFVGAGEVTYEGEQEFARAIEAELGVMPAAPRRDAADTEPHGTNERTAESAPDKGPWQVDEWREGRGREIVLQSHDFTHDVALIVNGDFADLAEKLAYANRLAAQMNSAPAPGESADPQSQGDTQ